MDSQRILITGLSSHWGGRLAQAIERDLAVETIVGVDLEDPRHELHRTEFVRVQVDDVLLRRIIEAAAIDTVIDTRLIADPLAAPLDKAHEVNVTGTRNLVAACSGARSPVRKLVFKSSAQYYGCEQDDPAFFTEDQARSHSPATEDVLAELAAARPEVTVTILRLAEPVGPAVGGSYAALFSLPVVPSILGFDPRCQFIHEDDVIGALEYAARCELPGIYNAAGDGVLALSEVVSMLGKPQLPVLPPWGTVLAAAQLRRLGLRIPVELLRQLRFGRGLDNRKLKAAGYVYRYTSRESILKLRAHQRLRPLLRSGSESYRYEREVEEFLRWSHSVNAVRAAGTSADERRTRHANHGPAEDEEPDDANRALGGDEPGHAYDELGEGELIELIATLDADGLRALRSYELARRRRAGVLAALDQNLARRGPTESGGFPS
jgi:UDP-glucose 4-epimerase